MSGGAAQSAAARVTRNTAVRAVADLLGKFASLALIAVLARKEGPVGVGALVFAFAWCEIATAPIDMGLDRYLLRRVATDRAELDRRFYNVFFLKLARALPVVAASWALILLIEPNGATRAAVFVLTASLLLDGLSWTVFAAFNALERADLIAAAMIVQRLVSAGAGVLLLVAGYGVVAVTGAYALASAAAFAVAMALLARRIGMPARIFPTGPRRDLNRRSLPFAAQELMSAGIARVDAVLLATLATQAIVGYYGAAYRLLEATLFLSAALQGAFAAMYTYLSESTEPTINAVFQRSIKLSLALLTPCAVVLSVLAAPILELLFGSGFDSAVTPLRLLGLSVVPLGLVMLSTSLISSRRDPKVLVLYSGLALASNVALNLALIPPLEADGAALAMLVTYVIFAAVLMRLALRTVGRLRLGQTLGAPLTAGLAAAGAAILLEDRLLVALPACAAVYLAIFGAVERRLAPADFDFMVELVRGRLRSRKAARLPNEAP